MKFTFKHIIFSILIATLVLPAFQHVTKFIDAGKLHGDFVLAPRPQLSLKGWNSGAFQAGFDRYIEDHIGFRNFFVRLNNELDFTFFGKANADGVVVGKENQLFEYDYIRAFTGGDFIGKSTIERKMNKVKYLQDFLKETHDIDFILILEPSKARTYPQYIPDRYLENGISISNYEYFVRQADALHINYLDLNRIYLEARDSYPHPLYPPYGIHWSQHSMSFVVDTMIRFFEHTRNIDMPDFDVEVRFVADSICPIDYDVGHTINLLFQLPQPPIPYSFFRFHDDENKTRPMVLAVADSYYWNIFNSRIPEHLFANQAFWYFNAKVYPDFYFGEKWTRDLDLQTEVEKQDIIFLSVTERFLYKFDWGFVDDLYRLYTPPFTGDIIERYENTIRRDAEWFDMLAEKAEKSGKPLETIIRDEAEYTAIQEDFQRYLAWHGVEYFKTVIRKDTAWNTMVEKDALEKNVDYEQHLEANAVWVFANDHPEIFRKYKAVKSTEKQILNDSTWLWQVTQKAEKYRMPLSEMIAREAEFMASREFEKVESYEKQVRTYEELIRKDAVWLEDVKKKAAEKGIDLNTMIRMDAEFMVNENQRKTNSN